MSSNNSNQPWSWSSQEPPPNDLNVGPYWSGPPPPHHPGYGSYPPYGFPPNVPPPAPRMEGYGGYRDHGFAFDPSVPPPPFNCSPGQFPPALHSGQGALLGDPHSTGPFTPMAGDRHNDTGPSDVHMYGLPQTASVNSSQGNQRAYSTFGDSEPGFTHQHQPHEYRDLTETHSAPVRSFSTFPAARGKEPDQSLGRATLDESVIQRRQDEQWVRQFLHRRKRTAATKIPESEQAAPKPSPSQFREMLYGALHLVSKLSLACDTLKQNLEDQDAWAGLYLQTQGMKKELQEKLLFLKGYGHLEALKSKLLCTAKRRARLKRQKLLKREEMAEDRFAEKEAAIDKWRLKRIQAVEEKKRVSSSCMWTGLFCLWRVGSVCLV